MDRNSLDKIRKMSETLAKNPDSLVFASLAELYVEQEMIDQAIKMCLSGLRFHPNYLNGHRVLAEAYLAKKMIQSAKAEYERILELNPTDEAIRIKLEALATEEMEVEPAPTVVLEGPQLAEATLAAPPEEKIEEMIEPGSEEREAQEEMSPAASAMAMDTIIRGLEAIRKEGEPPPIAEPEEVKIGGLSTIDQTLDDLLQKPGVKAAILMEPSGLLVGSASDVKIDIDERAAFIAGIFSSSERTMERLNLGGVNRIVVERGGSRILITKAGEFILAVETETTMKLGLLIVSAKRASKAVQQLVT